MPTIETRAATAADEPFLWRMLTLAASMDGGDHDVDTARTDPALRGYVEAFGEPGDLGVIAIDAGTSVGAAWLRLLRGQECSPTEVAYGSARSARTGATGAGEPIATQALRGASHESKLWTHDVPELAIATIPALRGAGTGALILHALIDAARAKYPAIVLSVREGNPAVRLYERFGFVVERRITNRVGGTSLAMRLTF